MPQTMRSITKKASAEKATTKKEEAAGTQAMSTQEINKQSVVRMNEAFNTGRLEIIDDLLAASLTDNTPGRDPRAGSNGIKKKIGILRQAFPDLKFTIEQMVAEGDTVAFRWKMSGTQSGEFIGYKASNKQIEQFGNDFVTFKEGKIISHYSASDSFRHILEKLGHEPRVRVVPKEPAS